MKVGGILMVEFKFIKENKSLIKRYCSGVYAIRNDLNNKMYVGSSSNIRNRYEYHFDSIKKGKFVNKKLQEEVDKIGIDKFSFLILEECDDVSDTLKYLECKYIELHGDYNVNSVDGKPVYCYTKTGEFVKEYKNIKSAAKDVDGLPDNIRAVIDKRKKSYRGFQWSYVKTDKHDMYKVEFSYHPNKCKAVDQFTLDGKYIKTYRSIHEAARDNAIDRSNLQDALRKKRKSAGGYKWSYSIKPYSRV